MGRGGLADATDPNVAYEWAFGLDGSAAKYARDGPLGSALKI